MSLRRSGTTRRWAVRALLAGAMATALSAPLGAQPVVGTAVAELPMPMPAVPKAADLVQFEFKTTSRHHFAFDPASMLLRGNEILQLTIVVTTSGGAVNVSYEGFDCRNATHRLLAIASPDGSWHPVENSQWVGARSAGLVLGQHHAIYQAACSGGTLSGERDVIVRRLVNPPNDIYR
jgi:hypothetical protein